MSIRRFHPARSTPLVNLLGTAVLTLAFAGCPGDDDCSYAGQSHKAGESFSSTDGCNTCSCTARGEVACTTKGCVSQPGSCRKTGCSGQLCSDQDVASTCEYRNEYACYQTATCARQADGKCGFTATNELTQCLATGGPKDGGQVSDSGTTTDSGTAHDATSSCDFAHAYEYGNIGGFVAWTDRSYLSPGNKYRHVRTPVRGGGAETSCMPAMPPCGAQDIITAYDVEVHDLTNADVRAALAESPTPLFGYDQRPVDGIVFEFKIVDGGSFLVGADCGTRSDCRAIPDGIKQLRNRLLALDTQQLAAAECKAAGFTQ
jgi:hypothetical protein